MTKFIHFKETLASLESIATASHQMYTRLGQIKCFLISLKRKADHYSIVVFSAYILSMGSVKTSNESFHVISSTEQKNYHISVLQRCILSFHVIYYI